MASLPEKCISDRNTMNVSSDYTVCNSTVHMQPHGIHVNRVNISKISSMDGKILDRKATYTV